MASMVLMARYPSAPGAPANAPHRAGATTASTVFSATDSTVARAISAASRPVGSLPTRAGSSSPRPHLVARRQGPAHLECRPGKPTAAHGQDRSKGSRGGQRAGPNTQRGPDGGVGGTGQPRVSVDHALGDLHGPPEQDYRVHRCRRFTQKTVKHYANGCSKGSRRRRQHGTEGTNLLVLGPTLAPGQQAPPLGPLGGWRTLVLSFGGDRIVHTESFATRQEALNLAG